MPQWISRIKPYERHLSVVAMAGGFIFDNFAFGRIDHPATQLVFAGYLLFAAVSIALLHFLEAHERADPRWRTIISWATQFALGALWSAFLIFYSRSAAPMVSWPFLLALTAILLGNELLREYHARLAFTVVLFFIALFSYAMLVVPMLVGTINEYTFLFSGAVALAAFTLYLLLLAALGRRRIWEDLGKVAKGAGLVFAAINLFYFLNMLPPIPLALADSGLYQRVERGQGSYRATGERQHVLTRFGYPAVVHLMPGQSLTAYSAVFAPIQLNTRIEHRWQRQDRETGRWRTAATITYPITGGRDNGYRGFTIKSNVTPGKWRVDIATPDGRIIGRIPFRVESAAQPPHLVTRDLR